MTRKVALLLSVAVLTGCTDHYGPNPILGPNGVIGSEGASRRAGAPEAPALTISVEEEGGVAESAGEGAVGEQAYQRREVVMRRPLSGRDEISGAGPDLYARFEAAARVLGQAPGEADTGPFLASGFALVYANCDHYFQAAGHSQTGTRFVRDTIAPVVALLTGIISLRNFDSGNEERLLTGLSLWSSTTTAAFDIYERNFLFGAENIDSVRELILNALTTHSDRAFATDPDTFEAAAIQIIDNQNICTPPHILRLVREAIRNGTVQATVTGSAEFQTLFEIRRALGQLLHPPAPLSVDETYALWVLFVEGDTSNLKGLYPLLRGLASNPITETAAVAPATEPTYSLNGNWPHTAAVIERLVTLPNETLAEFGERLGAVGASDEGGGYAGPRRVRGPRRSSERVSVSVGR